MMMHKNTATNMRMEIIELSHHLRNEHLFVAYEKQQIQKLNEKILEVSSHLFHMLWISRQQRINLDQLLLSHSNTDLLHCCHISNALDSVNIIDAYKRWPTHETTVSEFFTALRKNPQLIGHCLIAGERVNGEMIPQICHIIMSSIYSHCILHEDKTYLLQMLKEIITYQLLESDNPRRLLRHGSCAFSRIYRVFSEELIEAKIFLTSALHNGVMQILAEDDLFLDIDPSKAVIRFAPQERVRHFGHEGTETYNANLLKYRLWTIKRLTASAMKFIEGIRNNMYNFPQCLSWIVKQLYSQLMKKKKIDTREIGTICADLIFEFFICPAIVNPDLYGVTNAHISHIARFNLMQIAQIIQLLSMTKWEEIDPKLNDLYGAFQKDCMSSVLDFILENSGESFPPDDLYLRDVTRKCVLISDHEFKCFLQFLNGVRPEIHNQSKKKILDEIMEGIPQQIRNETYDHNDKTLKTQTSKNLVVNVQNNYGDNSPKTRKSILNRVTRRSKVDAHKGNELNPVNSDGTQLGNNIEYTQISDVIVIPIMGNRDLSYIGMLSEEKVLRVEQQKRHTKVRMNVDIIQQPSNDVTENVGIGGDAAIEKRTRFSLSQDQESLGMSDNLEAISEAASNHSVESSLDLENENDNMSDMVSANVSSGRGTPNVSGRDTPSSHSPNHSNSHSSDEEPDATMESGDKRQENQSNARALNAIPIAQPNRPNNRDDIEDRFGKFDIKTNVPGDETKSMLSDTWSTDVLASDSEAFEQSDAPAMSAMMAHPTGMNVLGFSGHQSHHQPLFDSAETASQSDAWSTDVLTSDTERMQEFDPDECASITRSDDMSVTRSEPDDENFVANTNELCLENDFPKDGTIKYKSANKSNISENSNLFHESQETVVELSSQSDDSKETIVNYNNTNLINVNDCTVNSSTLLTMESIDVSPSSSLSIPSLLSTNMQSLGRLSFDIRKFDENLSKLSLQENTIVGYNLNRIKNGSSVAELLIDFPKIKETESLTNNKESNNLIDYEKENSSQPSLVFINKIFINEQTDDIKAAIASNESRFSFTSISSTSTNSSVNSSDHIKQIVENSDKSSPPIVNSLTPEIIESTGAIPKNPNYSKLRTSINSRSSHHFESTDDMRHHPSNRKSFFKLSNFKSTFREKMKSFKEVKRAHSLDASASGLINNYDCKINDEENSNKNQSSDEILTKYRTKVTVDSTMVGGSKIPFNGDLITGNDDDSTFEIDETEVFNKIKRKIRRVLSTIDVITFSRAFSRFNSQKNIKEDNELLKLLRSLLAEAIYMHHSNNIVMLHEAIRSIECMDENGCQKLFWSLREDYQRRAAFIAYLTRSRQQLLSILAYFDSVTQHIKHDRAVCSYNLVSISVRQFLEKKEKHLQIFIKKFQSLEVSDEKPQLVEKFLTFLFSGLENDSSWQSASEEQMKLAKQVIERHVMSQIYILALYPNGDGDVLRDQIISQHIENLSKVISPNHKDLGIPKVYHSECPWQSAQNEILAIDAYKTPRDKVLCVVRCCAAIMNLLSLSYDKSVPAADDLMPVLVYVIIKANPMSLLSTVQYVNSFYEKYFEGEEAYWWTQFCSAIEFIKTMD